MTLGLSTRLSFIFHHESICIPLQTNTLRPVDLRLLGSLSVDGFTFPSPFLFPSERVLKIRPLLRCLRLKMNGWFRNLLVIDQVLGPCIIHLILNGLVSQFCCRDKIHPHCCITQNSETMWFWVSGTG